MTTPASEGYLVDADLDAYLHTPGRIAQATIGVAMMLAVTTSVPVPHVSELDLTALRGMGRTSSPRLDRSAPHPPAVAGMAAAQLTAAPLLEPVGGAASAPLTTGDRVRLLHESSGLTWEQLAKLFGVSRRALHMWASGGRLSTANVEQLGRLEQVIRDLPADHAAARRTALLDGSRGQSVYDAVRAEHTSSGNAVTGHPLTPAELLDVEQA